MQNKKPTTSSGNKVNIVIKKETPKSRPNPRRTA